MVGNIVRQIRVAVGQQQKEMAEKLHIDAANLSRIENGKRFLDKDTFNRIVCEYNLDDYMRNKLTEEFEAQPKGETRIKRSVLKEENDSLKTRIDLLKTENDKLKIENNRLKECNNMLNAENRMFSSKIREIKELVKKFEFE